MKIARIERQPFYGEDQLTAVMEDGTEEFLFGYDSNDYLITDRELIGKTISEAHEVLSEKIRKYFESHLW